MVYRSSLFLGKRRTSQDCSDWFKWKLSSFGEHSLLESPSNIFFDGLHHSVNKIDCDRHAVCNMKCFQTSLGCFQNTCMLLAKFTKCFVNVFIATGNILCNNITQFKIRQIIFIVVIDPLFWFVKKWGGNTELKETELSTVDVRHKRADIKLS